MDVHNHRFAINSNSDLRVEKKKKITKTAQDN